MGGVGQQGDYLTFIQVSGASQSLNVVASGGEEQTISMQIDMIRRVTDAPWAAVAG